MKSETIRARGHVNVLSTHRNTVEFTKEEHLTKKGDCIVAVGADKSMLDLPEKFKEALKDENAKIEVTIECGGIRDKVTAYGHPALVLTHPTDFVVRKSNYICPRTLAMNADKAAKDLDRKLVEELKKGSEVIIKIAVI